MVIYDSFGTALRSWRRLKGLTQEALAFRTDSSTRHLSFLESGKAQPSRQAVLDFGVALELPLREQNALLEAAGFAKAFRESNLDDPQLAQVSKVLGWILSGCEPNGAIVLDRGRNILQHNSGWLRLINVLVDYKAVFAGRQPNALHLLFHPLGFRTVLKNWQAIARAELSRLHTELRASGGSDNELEKLLRDLTDYPDVPENWLLPHPTNSFSYFLPMQLTTPLGNVDIFSTLTSIGSPRDVTLEEIRVQAYCPANEATESVIQQLYESDETPTPL
jgi:transcriptional regulator with XRE-family HTH domain